MRIVITDTNVLINLLHTSHLHLLTVIPDHEFVLCTEVLAELRDPTQQRTVEDAVAHGELQLVTFTSMDELDTFAELRDVIGRGEAASLAIAEHNDFAIASDEKRIFRREAIRRVGGSRIVTTTDIYLMAIRASAITVEDADVAKAILERNRFRVSFQSYQDLLDR